MISIVWGLLSAGWGRVMSALAAGWGWACRNPAWALATAAVLFGAWEWHEAASVKRDLTVARAAFATEQAAFRQCAANGATLQAALAAQNASIEGLHRDSDARQNAAQAAQRAAVARDAGLLATATRIAADAPHGPPAASCATPPDVLAARGDL